MTLYYLILSHSHSVNQSIRRQTNTDMYKLFKKDYKNYCNVKKNQIVRKNKDNHWDPRPCETP